MVITISMFSIPEYCARTHSVNIQTYLCNCKHNNCLLLFNQQMHKCTCNKSDMCQMSVVVGWCAPMRTMHLLLCCMYQLSTCHIIMNWQGKRNYRIHTIYICIDWPLPLCHIAFDVASVWHGIGQWSTDAWIFTANAVVCVARALNNYWHDRIRRYQPFLFELKKQIIPYENVGVDASNYHWYVRCRWPRQFCVVQNQ